MKFINHFPKRLTCLLLFSFVIYGTGESASSKKQGIKVKISYQSIEHGNFNTKKFKLNHPVKISNREIEYHLNSLKYIENFLGSKEESVFSNRQIKKIVPIFEKAFKEISPKKIIHFELESEGRKTTGHTFSFKKHLNWRFDSIRGETFFQKNDHRQWDVFAWQLVPGKGHLFFKSGPDTGNRINKNWIVVHRNQVKSILKNQKKLQALKNDHKKNPKLEEKLKQLKKLYDQDLIDEEEYKIQQKKLFEELF